MNNQLRQFTVRLLKLSFVLGLLTLLNSQPAVARRRPLAQFYAVNEPSSWESLRRNVSQVDILSPQWLTLDQQGRLQPSVDASISNWAKQQRVKVMPLLMNAGFDGSIVHDLLQDDEKQLALIRALVEASRANGFWGIQLDLENVPGNDRAAFVVFVRTLATEFHRRHLKLSISVPAPLRPVPASNTPAASAWEPNERAAGFDYRELGRAADFVSLMAYDEHVSEPGPVAGLPWVEACLEAVLPLISHKQLWLGIPLYYRHWQRAAGENQRYVVREGAYAEAIAMAASWGVKPELDVRQQELKIAYQDEVVGHAVWFADGNSVQRRLDLVKRYRLPGFSAWRLGQEDPAVWDLLSRGAGSVPAGTRGAARSDSFRAAAARIVHATGFPPGPQ